MVRVQGLNVRGGITSSMAPQLELDFEPSVIITTGRINKMGASFRSFREPLTDAIRKVMMPSIWENFESGGRPKWAPLSEATLLIRRRWGYSGTDPLTWTGRLSEVAASFEIWTITQSFATIQSLPAEVWYGKIHQVGYEGAGGKKSGVSKGKRDKTSLYAKQRAMLRGEISVERGGAASIPARPFIMFQEEDVDSIHEIFDEWLAKKIGDAWPAGR